MANLDRPPLLTWIMFLKLLDDHEQVREERAKMKREKYRPAIDPPYRWRDWAAREGGVSKDQESPARVQRVFRDYRAKLFRICELPQLIEEIRTTGKDIDGTKG